MIERRAQYVLNVAEKRTYGTYIDVPAGHQDHRRSLQDYLRQDKKKMNGFGARYQ